MTQLIPHAIKFLAHKTFSFFAVKQITIRAFTISEKGAQIGAPTMTSDRAAPTHDESKAKGRGKMLAESNIIKSPR